MPTVYIGRCRSYALEEVQGAVQQAVAALGGLGRFVRPGMRVLIKPNLLLAKAPDTAIDTHPALVQVVAQMVREAGAEATIADSSGGGTGFNPRSLRALYRISGMDLAAGASGAILNEDCDSVSVPCPNGRLVRMLDIMRAATRADVIINLPKLKTHGLLRYTGAVKNLFGLIPGRVKLSYHSKLQDTERFADMLLDLGAWARPALNIMDAIVAMEGEGPAAGRPRELGLLLASDDANALDLAALDLIRLDPQTVPTIRMAQRRGLLAAEVSDLQMTGIGLAAARVKDFHVPMAGSPSVLLGPPGLKRWLERRLVARPQAGPACTGCGVCAENCPVGAITIANRRAHMNMDVCIRCYCCHELCPQHAVALKRIPLAGLIARI